MCQYNMQKSYIRGWRVADLYLDCDSEKNGHQFVTVTISIEELEIPHNIYSNISISSGDIVSSSINHRHLFEYLRKTGQKAKLLRCNDLESLKNSQWIDVFQI